MADIVLRGITWNHSRGITPLQAASQRFAELNPGIEVRWEKRSLQHFADYPIEKLTKEYDLLIIDHPWVGTAAATQCVLPLDEYISADYLQDQLIHSVGESFISYNYNGHQWALSIDAAVPAASYRKDLLEANNMPVPATWDELLSLAKAGRVAVPAIPIDLLMNFYTFCLAHGEEPFKSPDSVTDLQTGTAALETMQELYGLVDRAMFEKNPISVAELMTGTDEYWYCPFAYGYSNYSRQGYAKNSLTYEDVVSYKGKLLRMTIGGTGMAVSACSGYKEQALAFAQWVGSEKFQTFSYTYNEGQPGYLKAWTNALNNQLTNNFFYNVLPVMQRGYLRPRYHGYLHFQHEAGAYVHDFVSGRNKNVQTVIEKINSVYRKSLNLNP